MAEDLSFGMRLAIAERREQSDLHGYDAAHDDDHRAGELVDAGIAYALAARDYLAYRHPSAQAALLWPWMTGFKPSATDPTKTLAKAAAFLIAEIDRLHRAGGRRG